MIKKYGSEKDLPEYSRRKIQKGEYINTVLRLLTDKFNDDIWLIASVLEKESAAQAKKVGFGSGKGMG